MMNRSNYYVVYWKDHTEFKTLPGSFEKALQDKTNLKKAGYYGYIRKDDNFEETNDLRTN